MTEEEMMTLSTGEVDRMDHVLGPGWLEEGERYWAAHYAAKVEK